MRTLIAGSRDIANYNILRSAMAHRDWDVTSVVSGGARGVDALGERWAFENQVEVEKFPADWKQYGFSAGMIRNCEMAQNCDRAVILWDGSSRGTKHMMGQLELHGVPYLFYVVRSKDHAADAGRERQEEFF